MSKKSQVLPAPVIETIVLKFELKPKLLPKYISKNIIRAITGPATYQGHG
jgi:hypothetical protein